MMKVFKYSLLALLVLVIAGVGYLATLDVNKYKGDVEAAATKATGRELHIDGDLHLALSLVPTVAVDGVRLANAPWGADKEMLKADHVEAGVSIIPLLSHTVVVNRLRLKGVTVSLERNKSGTGNWELSSPGKEAAAKTPAEPPAGGRAFVVEDVGLEDVHVIYKDDRTGHENHFDVDKLSAHASGADAPMEISLVAALDKLPIHLDGKVGSVSALLGNHDYPVDLQGSAGDVNLKLGGTVKQPMSGNGAALTFSVDASSLQKLGQASGANLPDVGPFSVSGKLTAERPAEGPVLLDDLKLVLGSTDLSGNATLALNGTRPSLNAHLSAQKIDLTPFMGKEDEKAPKRERIFSKDKLPVAALKSVDANVQLRAARVQARDNNLDNLEATLSLNNGRLQLTPVKADLAGGKLAMDFSLDGHAASPALQADVNIKGLVLGDLPSVKQKSSMTGGKTDFSFKGAGHGDSVAAIMGDLNGKLLVQVGKATIPNSKLNLAGADLLMETFSKLNPLSGKEPNTQLECAVVNFNIKDGMATTDKGIAMETDKMTVVGSGGVNLKTEQLDIGMRPHAREGVGVNLGNLASAARLGGTLANPHPTIDAAGALRAGVSAGAAVATFGASFLAESLFDKTTADPNPCATALGVKTAAAPKTEKPAEKTTSPVDKVKGALDKLFGN